MARIYLTYRPEEGTGDETQLIAQRLEQDWGADYIILTPAYEADDILTLAERVQECDALILVIGPFWEELVDEEHRHILSNPTDYQYTELVAALEVNMWISIVRLKGARPLQGRYLPEPLRGLITEDQFPLDMAALDEAFDELKRRIRISRRKARPSARPAHKPPMRPLSSTPAIQQPGSILGKWINSPHAALYSLLGFLFFIAVASIFWVVRPFDEPPLPTFTNLEERPLLSATSTLDLSLIDLQATMIANARATQQTNALRPENSSAVETASAALRATVVTRSTESVEQAYARRLEASVLDERLLISSDTLAQIEALQTMRVPDDVAGDAYHWAVFSPNGRYLFVQRSFGLTRYDMESGRAEREERESANIQRLAPLNNGGYLALFEENRIAQVDWPSAADELPMVHDLVDSYGEAWDVASDGELLAFGFADGTIYIVGLRQENGFNEVSRITLDSPPTIMVAHKGRLALVTEDGAAFVYEMATARLLFTLPATESTTIHAMNLSADGRVLALAFSDGRTGVFSVDEMRRLKLIDQAFVHDVALNPNGTLIALAQKTDGLRLIGINSDISLHLQEDSFSPMAVNFSADGRTLVASNDQKVTIYGVTVR